MARRVEVNGVEAAMELIMQEGFEGLGEAIRTLINEAMRVERSRHLGADAWERREGRQGYANGYKPKTVKSRLGELTLALAEMYIQGVSTRKVAKVTEELCGFEVSSTEVSRCTALLDEGLTAWRQRELGACPYVVLDARYETVRHGGQVVDCAVLVALGVRGDGKRDILGVSVALSEAQVH